MVTVIERLTVRWDWQTGSARNAYWQVLVALDEVRAQPPRLAGNLDHRIALQDLLPDHPQLHLRQALAEAAVDPEAEGGVLARPRPVDDELARPLDGALVAVARDVPHGDL